MGSVRWTDDALVSVKAREDLFCIGMLKRSPYIWFFDIHNDTGQWHGVDLNEVSPLFCVGVGRVVIQRMVVKKMAPPDVIPPKSMPIPKLWIKPNLNTADWKVDNFTWRGGRLIEIDPNIGSVDAPVIQANLDPAKDGQIIETHELTNLWGDQDLSDRLCRWFDKGINRDDLKFEIFQGLWNDRDKLRPLTRRLPVPFR